MTQLNIGNKKNEEIFFIGSVTKTESIAMSIYFLKQISDLEIDLIADNHKNCGTFLMTQFEATKRTPDSNSRVL